MLVVVPGAHDQQETCPQKKPTWLASWQSSMEPSHARSVRKRSNADSSAHAPASCITPQQKQTLEEALVTVASWDRLMGTEAEEEGEATALSAALAFLRNQSWWPRPKESVNLPLFIRASQECVTPPSQTGRRLSHGSPPSPSKARTPNSPASPAIILQRQWLAAMLKIAEADDLSWGGRLLRGDDLLSITPPEDLKQRGAQRAVSPCGQARVCKSPVIRRRDVEQLPVHQTQAIEVSTWPLQQPSSKPPRQLFKPVAAHAHRAGWSQAVCLLAAATLLSAVAQARAPEAGRLYAPLITAGDAAVLSAQGVLRLCKEEKRCAAAQEHLSHLTPTQRRKLGSLGGWDRYHFVGRSYRTDDDWGETTPSPTGRRVWKSDAPLNAVYLRY